jgi:hypothetical protein
MPPIEPLKPLEPISPSDPAILADPTAPRGASGSSRKPGSFGPAILFTLAAGMLLGLVAFFAITHIAAASGSALWNHLATFLTGRSTTIDVSSPAVIERIRKLSRLETVVYSLDKIVSGQRESAILPDFLAGDKLLLIAHGDVVAGIDMSLLKDSDVSVQGDSVRVRLPASQVLTARIDNKRTLVYSRTTGLLVTADPSLESKVREAAEEQITQAAIDDGILLKARDNAQASIATLLYGLGFHTVDVK